MKYSINLLPIKELSLSDKVVYFSFHYLRYILVITQFVVICVFFYRFQVDQEIVDLKDTISQKESIVKSTNSLLKEVDTVNKQVDAVDVVLKKQDNFVSLYNYFFDNLPSSLSLTAVNIENNSISCKGSTLDVESVKTFYERIKQENKFKKVELKNINKTEGGYTFDLSLEGYIAQKK